jgi:hypothetical protein
MTTRTSINFWLNVVSLIVMIGLAATGGAHARLRSGDTSLLLLARGLTGVFHLAAYRMSPWYDCSDRTSLPRFR